MQSTISLFDQSVTSSPMLHFSHPLLSLRQLSAKYPSVPCVPLDVGRALSHLGETVYTYIEKNVNIFLIWPSVATLLSPFPDPFSLQPVYCGHGHTSVVIITSLASTRSPNHRPVPGIDPADLSSSPSHQLILSARLSHPMADHRRRGAPQSCPN